MAFALAGALASSNIIGMRSGAFLKSGNNS
jgi:hypothetical protein